MAIASATICPSSHSPRRPSTCPTSPSPRPLAMFPSLPSPFVAIASMAICLSLPLRHVAITSTVIYSYSRTPHTPTTCLTSPLPHTPKNCPSLHPMCAPDTLSHCQLSAALLLSLPAAESFFWLIVALSLVLLPPRVTYHRAASSHIHPRRPPSFAPAGFCKP